MKTQVLELTYFVGTEGGGPDENLMLLMETLQEGMLLPDYLAQARGESPMQFVEPSCEAIQALAVSGYGLGFSMDFLSENGFLRDMQVRTVHPAPLEGERRKQGGQQVWECEKPIPFDIEDIQTIYLRDSDAVTSLRIAFPRYAGTFVVLET